MENKTASVPFSGADAVLFFILSNTALKLQAFVPSAFPVAESR